MKQIGKNIKHLRQKHEWNQGKVAEKLGISIPAYSKIETGQSDINILRLHKLAAVFKVSLLEILNDPSASLINVFEVESKNYEAKLLASEKEIGTLQRKVIALYDEIRDLELFIRIKNKSI
jgi:transcriptional regulator with XRE-family HTH domain